MNKKLLCLILVFALCVTLMACVKKNVEVLPDPATHPTEEPTQEPPTEATQTLPAGVATGEIELDWEEEPATEGVEEETQETTAPTESTKPTESTTPTEATKPQETKPTTPQQSALAKEYTSYMDMSADQQMAYIESFDSIDAFMAWFNAAKEEYNKNDGAIEIGSGEIDLEALFGKQ